MAWIDAGISMREGARVRQAAIHGPTEQRREPAGIHGVWIFVRSRRVIGLIVTVTVGCLAIAALVSGLIMVWPMPLPKPSRGVRVAPVCPSVGSEEYFFPARTLAGDNDNTDKGTRAWFSGHLRAAGAAPLWCGDRTDTAYRFMLVFEWGKTKLITVHRSSAGWMLHGAEFKHPTIARFTVDRRVSRPLSPTEATELIAALDGDGFWLLPSQEPDRGCCYDGPLWFIEGGSPTGYHHVMRAWDKQQIVRTGRLFMQLAGLQGEENTPPEATKRSSRTATDVFS